jgi:hypothetical protein
MTRSTLILCSLALGCAADLSDALDDADTTAAASSSGGNVPAGAQIEHMDQGDGTTITIVDASDAMAWIYLDLESLEQREVADPTMSDAWDLGFSRFNISTNGGTSGTGGMTVQVVEGATLDQVDASPNGEWIVDAPDGDDQGDDPDYALAGWYDYDFATHVLSPKPLVYLVRSVEGNTFALAVLDYYDDAGSSGFMKIHWKPLP